MADWCGGMSANCTAGLIAGIMCRQALSCEIVKRCWSLVLTHCKQVRQAIEHYRLTFTAHREVASI